MSLILHGAEVWDSLNQPLRDVQDSATSVLMAAAVEAWQSVRGVIVRLVRLGTLRSLKFEAIMRWLPISPSG